MTDHAPVVRFARLESRAVLLGLGMTQLALVGIGVGVFVLAQYSGGASGAVTAAPLWAPPIVMAVLPWRGRCLVDWVPVLGAWAARRADGASRQRISCTATSSELVIPGVRRLQLLETPTLGAGVVHDGADSSATCVLRVDGSSFLLDGGPAQAQLVQGWASVLSSLAQTAALRRLQVVHRSVPGGTTTLRQWWAHRGTGDPWRAVVADLLAESAANSLRPETLLVVRWAGASRGRGADPATLSRLEPQLGAFTDAVAGCGLRLLGWANAREMVGLLRGSFDPDAVASRDMSAAVGMPPVAGVAMDEAWDHVRTESAVHAVYWVRDWPRTDTHAGFLHPMLNGTARRTFALVVEPVPLGRAMREIRRAKVEHAADDARNARWGRIPVEAERAEAQDVTRREQELVAGHAGLRFVGLLTVSADDRDQLAAACVATETAAAQSMCELRRLVGQQAAGFMAGAVPLARGVS